jgi:hypothetical protein
MKSPKVILQSKGDLGACLERMTYAAGFRSAFMGKSKPPLPYLRPLLDAIALFEELQVGYALIGGVAAMYYGQPRVTEDLDFVAAPGHMDVLAANPDFMKKHRFDPSCTWKLYHDSGVEVDIWKDEFADEILSRARTVEIQGHQIRIAEPHDLIAMKLRAGRPQDNYDITEIVQGATIDDSVVRQRVTPEQYEHYLRVKSTMR